MKHNNKDDDDGQRNLDAMFKNGRIYSTPEIMIKSIYQKTNKPPSSGPKKTVIFQLPEGYDDKDKHSNKKDSNELQRRYNPFKTNNRENTKKKRLNKCLSIMENTMSNIAGAISYMQEAISSLQSIFTSREGDELVPMKQSYGQENKADKTDKTDKMNLLNVIDPDGKLIEQIKFDDTKFKHMHNTRDNNKRAAYNTKSQDKMTRGGTRY